MHLKLILLLLCCSRVWASDHKHSPAQAEKKPPVIIRLQLPPKTAVSLTYANDDNQLEKISIRNSSDQDTLIRHELFVRRPSHIYGTANTSSTILTGNYLLLPGDTAVLQMERNKLSIRSYSQGKVQLGQLFWIPSGTEKEFQPVSFANTSRTIADAQNILKRIQDSTSRANQRIDSLYNLRLIHPGFYFALKQFSLVNHFHTIVLFSKAYPYLNNTYREMYRHLHLLNTIGSGMNHTILSMVVQQHATALSGKPADIWKALSLLPDSMKTKPAIQQFALFQLRNSTDARSRSTLQARINSLQKMGFSPEAFASFYEQFIRMENGKRMPVFAMVNVAGDTSNFQKLMLSLQGKPVLLEFWTSQTDSGRLLHQQWLSSKAKLKNNDVAFVSICLDGDEAHQAWLAAAGSAKEVVQLRVPTHARAAFLRSYRFNNASRYLLYNADTELVTNDFIRPGEKDFETALLAKTKK